MIPDETPAARDDLSGPLKRTAFSAAGILLSVGLCGTSLWLYPDDYVTWMGLLSLGGFIVSALFFIASLFGVAVQGFRRFRR